ncbi:related to meiotically up-regulated gene 136 protein precursor [Cephalotrichum gorgonifer]|uniref:Related to meiotically up-regulated gene 136 protein n=1 Tax=Cephalotrichum gorgonifer TaxID=2041049 RepID=A0AAE8MVI8_9PEZI|nr:related to meiotically up-regulated gene 136 protein precursor [Cephalotrichum gorgonifer]
MALPFAARRRSRTLIVLAIVAIAVIYLFRGASQQPFDPNYGLLNTLDADSRFAIVTFLGSDTLQKDEDWYFVGCRLLTYQLLHAEETRIRDRDAGRIDWVVAVTPAVEAWKREQLVRDGAKVVEVEDVPLHWWIRTAVARWKDQFTKLRILLWTEYARVLFVDADTLLFAPLDDIFDAEGSVYPSRTDPAFRKGDEAHLPAEYVFLAAQDHQFTGKRDHAVPPVETDTTGSFSAGFWLAAPSVELYHYLISVMGLYGRFDPGTMEQSLLNYAFRRCNSSQEDREASATCPAGARAGPMPWGELDWRWSSTWPSRKDRLEGVASLHEKFWKKGPDGLKWRWRTWRRRMEESLGPTYT